MKKSSKKQRGQIASLKLIFTASHYLKAKRVSQQLLEKTGGALAIARKIAAGILKVLLSLLVSGLFRLGQHVKRFADDFPKLVRCLNIRSRRNWRTTKTPYRIYTISMITMLVWFFSIAITKGAEWNAVLMYAGIFGFGAGFAAWLFPVVLKMSDSRVGRLSLVAVNAVVLVFAFVYARSIVWNALQLPPQDFDVTVSLIALATYIPMWLIIVSGTLFVAYVVLIFFGMAVKFIAPTVTSTFASIFGEHRLVQKASSRLSERATKALFHGIGSAVMASVAAVMFTAFNTSTSSAKEAVKWIAYWADFYPSGIYPGVPKDARIRLHENGVVSTARVFDDQVEITIANFGDVKKQDDTSK